MLLKFIDISFKIKQSQLDADSDLYIRAVGLVQTPNGNVSINSKIYYEESDVNEINKIKERINKVKTSQEKLDANFRRIGYIFSFEDIEADKKRYQEDKTKLEKELAYLEKEWTKKIKLSNDKCRTFKTKKASFKIEEINLKNDYNLIESLSSEYDFKATGVPYISTNGVVNSSEIKDKIKSMLLEKVSLITRQKKFVSF